ncbi:MAG: Fic family protein, partial [Phycisphaerales bacterium]|nr:Fic family protein [Phycisphaerales bacterium]
QTMTKSQLSLVSELLTTHQILLNAINDAWAGVLRAEQVMLVGATQPPPDATHIRELLEQAFHELAAGLNDKAAQEPGVVLAAWAHWAIARIHPFMDGNGRIARLWQDMILFQRGLTCAVIRLEDRHDYYAALAAADAGEFNNLIQIVAQRVLTTFDKYRLAQQRADEVVNWATEIAGEADTRLEERRKLEYMRWRRRIEELYFEFERCAAAITRASSEIEVQIVSAGIIDQIAWEELRAGSNVSDAKFFRVVVRRGAWQVTYYFFFGRHYWSEADGVEERAEPRVAVLISEQRGEEKAIPLYSSNDGVLPRRLFVMGDHFVRQRFDVSSNSPVNEKQLTALQIAQEFLGDVVLKRLTR